MLKVVSILIATVLLASCDADPSGKTEQVLHQFSLFNDEVQQWAFSKTKRAPSIEDKDLTLESGFRVNKFSTDTPPSDTTENWHIYTGGLVKYPGYYSLAFCTTIEE